jgi:hypothetical protein
MPLPVAAREASPYTPAKKLPCSAAQWLWFLCGGTDGLIQNRPEAKQSPQPCWGFCFIILTRTQDLFFMALKSQWLCPNSRHSTRP